MPLDFPDSPSTNDTFTSGGITWKYDGAKWRLLAGSGTPTYETSLSGSPVDGQEIYYAADAANGVIWHLRYRSAARSGSGAWEFVGGSPLFSGPVGGRIGNSSTYVALTSGPSLTVPRTGTYMTELSVRIQDWDDGATNVTAGISIGGATPVNFFEVARIDAFEDGRENFLVKQTFTTNDALTVRLKQRASESNSYVSDVSISLTPLFIY